MIKDSEINYIEFICEWIPKILKAIQRGDEPYKNNIII